MVWQSELSFSPKGGNINVERQLIESDVGSLVTLGFEMWKVFPEKSISGNSWRGILLSEPYVNLKQIQISGGSTGLTNEFENNGDLPRLINLTDPTIRKSLFQAAWSAGNTKVSGSATEFANPVFLLYDLWFLPRKYLRRKAFAKISLSKVFH